MRYLITLPLMLWAGAAIAQEAMTGDQRETLLDSHRTITLGGPG